MLLFGLLLLHKLLRDRLYNILLEYSFALRDFLSLVLLPSCTPQWVLLRRSVTTLLEIVVNPSPSLYQKPFSRRIWVAAVVLRGRPATKGVVPYLLLPPD